MEGSQRTGRGWYGGIGVGHGNDLEESASNVSGGQGTGNSPYGSEVRVCESSLNSLPQTIPKFIQRNVDLNE